MNRMAIPLLSAAVLLGATGCAQVQDMFGGSDQQASQPMSERNLTSVARLEPQAMIGKSVVAFDGQKVGEVDDVLLGRNNRAAQLIVGSGGVLGLGERNVALDIDNVRYAPQQDAIVATQLTKEQFAALPEFRYDTNMISLNRTRR